MINYKIIYGQIIEILGSIIECSLCLQKFYIKKNYNYFDYIYVQMMNSLNEIHIKIIEMKDGNGVDIAVESIQDSLNRIGLLKTKSSYKVADKIEFELIPLIKDLYSKLYFLGLDKNKDIVQQRFGELFINEYIEKSRVSNKYKYELSIIIIGYNKLEYTKLCIESLFKYIPKQVNYELILVNHGSTDGTKEYFESLFPTKQLDILKNGGGLFAVNRIIEGEYVLLISNDVLITKNSIENMMDCIKSNENIAWVVPSTPNVSNLQNIEACYSNMKEMYKFSELNNKKNKYKWEQRVRLCNPIDLKRSKTFFSKEGIAIDSYFGTKDIFLFPDDRISLLLRRNAYKMILAKDAYCHHFGSITIKDELQQKKEADFYIKGRKVFDEEFGIDPWGIGFCYDYNLFQYLDCKNKEPVNILGINCGMGSNPLKVRETIKEKAHNLNTKIYNITDNKSFLEDLKGVSDYVSEVKTELDIEKSYNDIKFDYIIFESNMENYKMDKLIYILKKKLTRNGVLCILNTKIKNAHRVESALYEGASWYILKK